MSASTDYYEVLQVSPNAEAEIIRAAYYRLAERWRAGSRPGDPGAAERIALLDEAHAVLSDPAKRRQYDWQRVSAATADGEGPKQTTATVQGEPLGTTNPPYGNPSAGWSLPEAPSPPSAENSSRWLAITAFASKPAFIALAVVGFFLYMRNDPDERFTRDTKEAERLRLNQEARKSVSRLAARHNAVTDWEARLCKGRKDRLSPILSIEVENAWIVGRPILFAGVIKEVSTAGPERYRMVIEQDWYVAGYLFDTTLHLSLNAPKVAIDTFLERHPGAVSGEGLENGVAVVATVAKVSSDEKFVRDHRTEYKIGHGELLDLIYIGGATLWEEPEKPAK